MHDLLAPVSKEARIAAIEEAWKSPRWDGIERNYSAARVEELSGTQQVEYTLASRGAESFWQLLHERDFVPALGALTGNQALQMVDAGLEAIYVSGWQVAADANTAGKMYPDQSLYPYDSVPQLVAAINNQFSAADRRDHVEGKDKRKYHVPIIADAEAGFGGNLNVEEITRAMIESGAAAIHYEDQLSSAKKCGHMGGKVLIPTAQAIDNLVSARFTADIMGVPTILIARTDADSAKFINTDFDPRDQIFINKEESRTPEGFYPLRGGKGGLEMAIARGLAFAPYADILWCETSTPDLAQAKAFARGIHAQFPDKLLAYNCSPSFNWQKNLDGETIEQFQVKLAEMGYKYQFITLAGFHTLNLSMFLLAEEYKERGMAAYVKQVQALEFEAAKRGYGALKHQDFVGVGYFDNFAQTVTGGATSVTAKEGSTEEEQF